MAVLRDLRVGLRILNKDRGFSALAIRGFSFPNADRLVSVEFIDPSLLTFDGVETRILAMNYEDLREVQQSFERTAAYLNGSTVNVTIGDRPVRYAGAYVTEDFFRSWGSRRDPVCDGCRQAARERR